MSSESQPPPQLPPRTPQFCFNERALRDFLRLSRSSLDDTISTQLNSLSTPSTTRPFNPLSISPKRPSPSSRTSTQTLPQPTCRAFLSQTLFPHWFTRDSVLTYCSLIATSPDPDDPDLALRMVEMEQQALRRVDERLDPYSGRWQPKEPRTERLSQVLRNEGAVERVVRARVWGVLEGRCGVGIGNEMGWEEEYDRWRKEHDQKQQR